MGGVAMAGCRALTDREVELVSKSFGGRYALRDRALFLLGVHTGFRISELLSLRVRDVWAYGRIVDVLTVSCRSVTLSSPRLPCRSLLLR
jgi:integrase